MLAEVMPDELTPREALETLYRLKALSEAPKRKPLSGQATPFARARVKPPRARKAAPANHAIDPRRHCAAAGKWPGFRLSSTR